MQKIYVLALFYLVCPIKSVKIEFESDPYNKNEDETNQNEVLNIQVIDKAINSTTKPPEIAPLPYNETDKIKDLKEEIASPQFKNLPFDKKNELRTELKTLIQEQMRLMREANKEKRLAAMEAERKAKKNKGSDENKETEDENVDEAIENVVKELKELPLATQAMIDKIEALRREIKVSRNLPDSQNPFVQHFLEDRAKGAYEIQESSQNNNETAGAGATGNSTSLDNNNPYNETESIKKLKAKIESEQKFSFETKHQLPN